MWSKLYCFFLLQTAVFTVILLPIRVAIICFFVISGWICATIGLWGISEQELREKPLEGWRNVIRRICARLICCVLVAGGFRLRVLGKQSSRSSSNCCRFSTPFLVHGQPCYVVYGAPTIVAKAETASIPFFGKGYYPNNRFFSNQLDSLSSCFGNTVLRKAAKDFVTDGSPQRDLDIQASRQYFRVGAPFLVI
ncbi:hypothetical protein NQ317_018334 [Molorchus minor]|uniref:Uncharacterized protein n=1 Tax=Molorchus minor TaxID=1323400 RepID=A0ABQ9J371_9CUCU|nr:hypothetical protein NQ317_018334 [Molorchus minor]